VPWENHVRSLKFDFLHQHLSIKWFWPNFSASITQQTRLRFLPPASLNKVGFVPLSLPASTRICLRLLWALYLFHQFRRCILFQPCVYRTSALLPHISGSKYMCTSQPSFQFRSQLPFLTFYVPSKVINLHGECRVVFHITFWAMSHRKHVLQLLQLIGWRNAVVAWSLCHVKSGLGRTVGVGQLSPGLRARVECR